MPQVLKEEVEARIRGAALAVFAEAGYPAARMADIARRAGVSQGNIYHYFAGKEALFRAVVPPALARRLLELLRARLDAARAASTAGDALGPRDSTAYGVAAEATLSFALANRFETMILLGRAEGTRHAGLAEEVTGMLVEGAVRHARLLHRDRPLPATLRFDLEQIYRSYVRAWVRLLERFPAPDEFRDALAGYERYHLAGLQALLS